MKKHLGILALLLLIANFSFAQKKDADLVKQTFEEYKTALLNDKGEEAVKRVDSRTIKYYGDMLALVRTADSVKTNKLSPMDKFMVLTIRHRATKEEIKGFDGTSLFVYAVKNGMVGKNSVANNSIGNVTVNGDFAKGMFMINGRSSDVFFHFYKENAQWKIDLTSIFPMGAMAFEQLIKDSGQDENAFLLQVLEMVSGTTPTEQVWQPVK